jgi:hypothetical protein
MQTTISLWSAMEQAYSTDRNIQGTDQTYVLNIDANAANRFPAWP